MENCNIVREKTLCGNGEQHGQVQQDKVSEDSGERLLPTVEGTQPRKECKMGIEKMVVFGNHMFRLFARLQNGCVTRQVCWWALGCLLPCAFNPHRWLASCSQHREKESRVSVFPCQYIAYPQQVLCSAFSRLQVSMGAARPQNRTARAKLT